MIDDFLNWKYVSTTNFTKLPFFKRGLFSGKCASYSFLFFLLFLYIQHQSVSPNQLSTTWTKDESGTAPQNDLEAPSAHAQGHRVSQVSTFGSSSAPAAAQSPTPPVAAPAPTVIERMASFADSIFSMSFKRLSGGSLDVRSGFDDVFIIIAM